MHDGREAVGRIREIVDQSPFRHDGPDIDALVVKNIDPPGPVHHVEAAFPASEANEGRVLELSRPLARAADRPEERALGVKDLDAPVAIIIDEDIALGVRVDVPDAIELSPVIALLADAEFFLEV